MAKDAGDRFVVTLPAAGARCAPAVFSASLNDLTATLIKVVSIFALIFFVLLPAHAQQTDELRKQIQERTCA
ncbi:MAG TPA: hypothetical protein VF546_20100 [Pyrinomonadaceae bacterium]|jgi:hypothetical protein